MNLGKKGTSKLIGIIFISILFFALVMNFSAVIGKVWNVITPVMLGAAIAFLINIPLKFFECRVFRKLTYSPNHKVWKKIKRAVCLTISVLLVLTLIAVLIVIIVPQIIDALKTFFVELVEISETFSVVFCISTELDLSVINNQLGVRDCS